MKRIFCFGLIFVFTVCNLSASASSFANSDEVKPKGLPSGGLLVRATFYFGDEDEENEPVKNVAFYLLSKSAAEILRSTKFEFDADDDQPNTDETYLEAAANAFLPNNRDDAEFVAALVSAELARHQKAKLKTDALGRARLRQITAGNYYLFGMARSDETVLVWNLPFIVKPGSNIIELDQHNAEVVLLLKIKRLA